MEAASAAMPRWKKQNGKFEARAGESNEKSDRGRPFSSWKVMKR
jgi:hypothetical protein